MELAVQDGERKSAARQRPFLPFLLIVLASAAAHLWCLNSVFYMDDMHVLRNESIREGRIAWAGLLTWTTFSYVIQQKLFGLSCMGVHAVNWLLHTSVACVLFAMGRNLVRGQMPVGVPFFAALLFGVHPLASEVPNYARCQDLAWVTLFSLLATWTLLSFLQDGGRKKIILLLLFIAGATLSKGPGMFHVGMMVALVGLAFLTTEQRKKYPRWWLWGGLFIAAALGLLWYTGVVPRMLNHTRMWAEPRFIGHGYTLARVFWEFAWRAVIPVSLSSDHHIAETLVPPGSGLWSIPDGVAMWSAASMLGVAALGLLLAWRKSTRLFGICLSLFVGTMLFRVLYLIPEFMPEYRIYPGLPWFCLGASIALHAIWKKLPGEGKPTLFAVLILIPCIILSARRSFVWHDLDRLTADILKQYPTQVRALWTLQDRDARAGNWQQVIERRRNDWPPVFRRFLEENKRLAPGRELPTGHLALADVVTAGHQAEAIAHLVSPAAGMAEIHRLEAYMKALRMDPVEHRLHWGYHSRFKALVLEKAGKYVAALQIMRDEKAALIDKADILRIERKILESQSGSPSNP